MGKFAKWAAEQAGSWKDNAKSQVERLRKFIPLTGEQTAALAEKLIRERAQMAYALGMKTRLEQAPPTEAEEFPFFAGAPTKAEGFDALQGSGGTTPGREIVVPLSKGASSALAGFGQSIRDYGEDLYKDLQLEKARGMAPTDDPASLPWFYAAQVKALPRAFMSGYQDAEKSLTGSKLQKVDAQLAAAKAQFEAALHAERGQNKIGSFNGFLDSLAEFQEKQADVMGEGDLSKILGYYLAAATALHEGADTVSYNWLAKRDPRRLQAKALESAVKRRARENPQPVIVTPEAEQNSTSTASEALLDALPSQPANKPSEAEVQQ